MQSRACILLVVFVGACTARENPEALSTSTLYGTWHLVSSQGRQLDKVGVAIHWRFDAEHITVIDGETGDTISQSTYRIANDTTPKHIDMEIDDIEIETRRGVYEIHDDQ